MKTILLIFLCSIMYADSTTVLNIIADVRKTHAPDKRTTIFTLNTDFSKTNPVISGETNLPLALEELKAKLKEQNIEAEFSVDILPEKNLGENTTAVVCISVANHRTDPKHSAEMATQSLMGTVVKVWKKRGEWYLVQTPDNYLGWVDDDGIQLMNQKKVNDWLASQRVIVTVPYALLRADADEKSPVVSDLTAGNILKKKGVKGNYFLLETPDGREGYLAMSNSDLFEEWVNGAELNAENILNSASEFMGYPYLWGGTSTKGVDCSGFTKSVYFMNGLITPRDASQQVYSGELVDTKDGFSKLEPGDLLFFGFKATDSTRERVTHVGIYIGDDDFIHSSGKVKINSLNKNKQNFSPFRFNTFIRAKRFFSNPEVNGLILIKNSPAYFLKENLPQ
ncbi:MAG: C40 family peptidase [Ignavibacteriaceae bacterium]|nr:C40 family peptidase [Ignavibacteriaceae bacterium]